MENDDNYVGLFAAGGLAKRLGEIGYSKEIFPLPQKNDPDHVVGDYLLSAFAKANIRDIVVITRPEKWDIQQCLGSGKSRDLRIVYLMLDYPWGTPFTLDQSWPYIKEKNVAMGFPDIIIEADNTFHKLKKKLSNNNYDVVLGLFKVSNSKKSDMVEKNHQGDVVHLDIKPDNTKLKFTWALAVWRPTFTQFMHNYLERELPRFEMNPESPEPYVGSVINSAIENGLRIGSVVFESGTILDIGTPEDLERAVQTMTST